MYVVDVAAHGLARLLHLSGPSSEGLLDFISGATFGQLLVAAWNSLWRDYEATPAQRQGL